MSFLVTPFHVALLPIYKYDSRISAGPEQAAFLKLNATLHKDKYSASVESMRSWGTLTFAKIFPLAFPSTESGLHGKDKITVSLCIC